MMRLRTGYNGDVGLFILNTNRWMVPADSVKVVHYTLGPFKPWNWWTPFVVAPTSLWNGVRERWALARASNGGASLADRLVGCRRGLPSSSCCRSSFSSCCYCCCCWFLPLLPPPRLPRSPGGLSYGETHYERFARVVLLPVPLLALLALGAAARLLSRTSARGPQGILPFSSSSSTPPAGQSHRKGASLGGLELLMAPLLGEGGLTRSQSGFQLVSLAAGFGSLGAAVVTSLIIIPNTVG